MKDLINRASRFCLNRSLGLVLIRVAVGLVFLIHGWQKIGNIPGVEGMMANFGLPGGTGFVIAWLEVVGGAAMILGVFTRVFGVIFGIEMLVAIYLTGIDKGYRPHELEIVLMLLSFGVALAGSGRYSVWKAECEECGGMLCDKGSDCTKKTV